MVCSRTAATVIASQAVITGAYRSPIRAIQLGLLPRLASCTPPGALRPDLYSARQLRRCSPRAAAGADVRTQPSRSAYGIAVTTTMVVDGVLGFIVIWKRGMEMVERGAAGRSAVVVEPHSSAPTCSSCSRVLGAAAVRVRHGNTDLTWQRGSRILVQKTRRSKFDRCADPQLGEEAAAHLPGHGGVLTSDPDFAPASLLHNLKHNKVLHDQKSSHNRNQPTHRARRRRAGADHADLRAVHPRGAALRFHGIAKRAQGPGGCAQTGLHLTSCRRRSSCRAPLAEPSAQSGMPCGRPAVHWLGTIRQRMRRTTFRYDRRGGEVGTQVACNPVAFTANPMKMLAKTSAWPALPRAGRLPDPVPSRDRPETAALSRRLSQPLRILQRSIRSRLRPDQTPMVPVSPLPRERPIRAP